MEHNISQKFSEIKRDCDGRAIVDMEVKDDTEFLSVYCKSDMPTINSSVADFLENATRSRPCDEQFTLRIHSNCIDDREKKVYKQAIKNYYTEEFLAQERERKRNNIISLWLCLVGLLFLVIAIYVDFMPAKLVWAEFIDIVAWVFLWESVDIFFLKNREMRLKRKKYLSFISMKVEYVKYKNKLN